MVLVGQEVFGDIRLAYGGAHDAEPAQPTLLAVPVHRVAAEDLGQRPIRNAELAEEQRAFDVRDARRHVGHEERGPDAVGGPVLPEDAPHREPLFDRHAAVLQLVPPGEVRREQFRRRSEDLIQQAPERSRVVNGLHRGVFRDGHADGTMPARRPCRAPSAMIHLLPCTWIMAIVSAEGGTPKTGPSNTIRPAHEGIAQLWLRREMAHRQRPQNGHNRSTMCDGHSSRRSPRRKGVLDRGRDVPGSETQNH